MNTRGDDNDEVVFSETPEKIVQEPKNSTGKFLKDVYKISFYF